MDFRQFLYRRPSPPLVNSSSGQGESSPRPRSKQLLTRFKRALILIVILLWLFIGPGPGLAAEPGTAPPASSPVSDQKPGSVLVYPFYSSTAIPATTNTRISMTNLSLTSPVFLRLFFIDQNGVLPPSNTFLCLTTVQTVSILMSEVDPGIQGFLVAIAVDGSGKPINFNFLVGVADIKLSSGHQASPQAEAIAAVAADPAAVVGTTATLRFDGAAYNRLPRTIAIDRLWSPADGNSTLLILTRITGNYTLTTNGMDPIGDVTGRLIGDIGAASPFSFTHGRPQLAQILSDIFPITAPLYSAVIPSNRAGWLKLWGDTDIGLFGVALNHNSSVSPTAHTGGHNLRHLTFSTTNSIILTMAAPTC